jgi:hypothetical protein
MIALGSYSNAVDARSEDPGVIANFDDASAIDDFSPPMNLH